MDIPTWEEELQQVEASYATALEFHEEGQIIPDLIDGLASRIKALEKDSAKATTIERMRLSWLKEATEMLNLYNGYPYEGTPMNSGNNNLLN